MKRISCLLLVCCIYLLANAQTTAYIRINQLGYPCKGVKVAVLGSKDATVFNHFKLINAATKQPVFESSISESLGKYGPFAHTYRLNFSAYKKKGKYYLQAGSVTSPAFTIDDSVYNGA